MSISEMVLFISSSSPSSRNLMGYIIKNNIELPVVRLDDKQMRSIASSGSVIKINVVPSLVVTYEDENIQMFSGLGRIISLFESLMNPPEQQEIDTQNTETNMYDTNNLEPMMVSKIVNYNDFEVFNGVSRQPPVIDSGDDLKEMDVPTKKRSNKKKDKKKKEKEVVNVEYLSIEEDDSPVSTASQVANEKIQNYRSSQSNIQPQSMKDIVENAKKMQVDAHRTLGYKDQE